jgi:hypothetical protein
MAGLLDVFGSSCSGFDLEELMDGPYHSGCIDDLLVACTRIYDDILLYN